MKSTIGTLEVSLKNNKKVKVFLFFLLLTTVIWLLIELSKSYISTATFMVHYKNVPTDKLLQDQATPEINVELKAPGFQLIKYKMKKHSLSFSLNNIPRNNSGYYLLPNVQIPLLKSQLSTDTDIINISNDTIFVDLGNNISKRVPVQSDLEMTFKLGYNLIDKLKLTPDSVLVMGPQKYVDTITEVTTLRVQLSDIYADIDQKLQLAPFPENKQLTVSSYSIIATAKVDKLTEGVLKIPVKIINKPPGVKINPFPKEIEVIYKAGFSNFDKINENSINIAFDYMEYKNDSLIQYLTPVILKKSDFIHDLKIHPERIEFLIQK